MLYDDRPIASFPPRHECIRTLIGLGIVEPEEDLSLWELKVSKRDIHRVFRCTASLFVVRFRERRDPVAG